MNFDYHYYILIPVLLAFHGIIIYYWMALGRIGKGGNGVFQVAELVTLVCLYGFSLNMLIHTCLMQTPDPIFFGTLLAGAGGGAFAVASDKKNRVKEENKSPIG